MMKKAGAGLLRSIMGLALIGTCWLSGGQAAWGQQEPESAVPQNFRDKAQARVHALQNQPVDEIEQAVLRSEQTMQKLNKDLQASRLSIRDLQEKIRLENPEVRAMYDEIDSMRLKINEYIDQIPEVKAQLDAAKEIQARLMEEAWYRTGAMGLVAEQDRAADFPERPEPVLDESETAVSPEQKEDLEP